MVHEYFELAIKSAALALGIGIILGLISIGLQKIFERKLETKGVILTITLWWYVSFIICITLLFRDKMSGVEESGNLVPIRSILEAIEEFNTEKILHYLANVLLFVPVGTLLAIKAKKSWHFIVGPVVCAALSCTIEILQVLFKVGIYDIDDIILNTLGGSWGWILCRSIIQKEKKKTWKLIVCSLLVFAGIGIYYTVQPYGTTKYRLGEKAKVERVEFSNEFQEANIPATENTYKILGESKSQAENTVTLIFDYLDASIAEYIVYDNCCVCYSEDRTFSLWYYYKDQHFEIKNYTYGIDEKIDASSTTGIREFLTAIEVRIPESVEYTREDDNIKIIASFVPEDQLFYDGDITLRRNGTWIESFAFDIKKLDIYKTEKLRQQQDIQEQLEQGEFYCNSIEEGEKISLICCESVDIVYEQDSRNYYRPIYKITAIIDGIEHELFIDAIAR